MTRRRRPLRIAGLGFDPAERLQQHLRRQFRAELEEVEDPLVRRRLLDDAATAYGLTAPGYHGNVVLVGDGDDESTLALASQLPVSWHAAAHEANLPTGGKV